MHLQRIPEIWDLVIIGGGITGAGVFREATRMGLKVLLVEQRDFAWGTSSRSSKLVHGGLRYIKEGHFLLTKIAVEERERLLKEAPGLVEALGFYLPLYKDQRPGKRTMQVGLSLYDLMARERQHKYLDAVEFTRKVPFIRQENLIGGFYFVDAQVDDSRLVLRLIDEGRSDGGYALNYTAVTAVRRNADGKVVGVTVEDTETRSSKNLQSAAVVNATGCWAEKLHPSPEPNRHLRPLRGSHLVFTADALPLKDAFSFMHPGDNRAVFVIPWEGAVLVGTTDLDHTADLSKVPQITEDEVHYLLQGIQNLFPSLHVTLNDCISAFAGVRPVLSEGKLAPSSESREHVVWVEQGLITVTGGKLTTFRRLAWDALKAAKPWLPAGTNVDRKRIAFDEVPAKPKNDHGLSATVWRRLYGHYGKAAEALVQSANPEDLNPIPGTDTLWAELPFAARHESIRHLSDLLLRRVRIGLLTPEGGRAHLKRIQKMCEPALPWDKRRWKEEIKMYVDLWYYAHALPHRRAEILAKRKFIFSRALRAVIQDLQNIYQTVKNRRREKMSA